jgi:uncharacterized repeat protein (TIGR04052 family)
MSTTTQRSRGLAAIFSSLCLAPVAGLAACGEDEHHEHHHDPDAAMEPDATPTPVPVTLQFAGRIDGAPFACGGEFPGLGSTDADFTAADFRLYVSDVRLVNGDGDEVAVALDVDDFQHASGVALLDFEDGAAGCDDGTAGTHTALTGTVPPGEYTGLRFTIGLPPELNHLDAAEATTPLNIIPMWWAWQFGYKFIKIDGAGDGAPFFLHVGSTGCPGADFEQPPTGDCTAPNQIEIALDDFDPAADTVVIDPAPVYADVDLTTNTVDTAPGCMSFEDDPECETVFPKLGLAYGAAAAGAQQLVTVE